MLRRSKDWLLTQLKTIGSSAAGVVAGQSPYQTPADLYDNMVRAHAGEVAEKALTDDMRRGLLTEPLHRDLLAEELGRIVHDHDQDNFLSNPQYPWAHALPDGWVLNTDTGEEIPVQLKCPRVRAWHEIRLKGIHGHWLLGSQHALAVMQCAQEIFSVLNVETMRLIQFPVYRDEKLIDSLMAIERKFWDDLNAHIRPDSILPQIELPPTTGELIEINTEDAMRAASTYLAAKEYADEAAILLNDAKARLKKLMGPARVVDFPGLRCYHQQQEGRITLDKKAMTAAGIDLNRFEKTGQPFMVFNAYPRRV